MRAISSHRVQAVLLATVAGASILVMAPAAVAAPSAAELERAHERLLDLEHDLQSTTEEYNLAAGRLAKIQARIGAADLEVEEVERQMREQRDDAVAVAQALYKRGTTSGMESILTAGSINEMERTSSYLQASEERQTEIFERLARQRAVHESAIAELEAAQAEAVAEEDRLADLRALAESKIDDQREEIARLQAVIERARQRDLARLQAQWQQTALTLDLDITGPPPDPHPRAAEVVAAALSQIGKPYVWAAEGSDSYDCSGLTLWAWAKVGVTLPHHSGTQFATLPHVAASDLHPGDLLFFGSPIHHVGMYIGDGQMVEAPYTGAFVRVGPAFRSDYVGAARPG